MIRAKFSEQIEKQKIGISKKYLFVQDWKPRKKTFSPQRISLLLQSCFFRTSSRKMIFWSKKRSRKLLECVPKGHMHVARKHRYRLYLMLLFLFF